jgi:hypothetical protein
MVIDEQLARTLVLEALRNHNPSEPLSSDSIVGATAHIAKRRDLNYTDTIKAWHNEHGRITLHPNLNLKILDIVWDLIVEGVLRPGFNESNPNYPHLHLTVFGRDAIKAEATPYDPDAYLKALKEKVPEIDPITFRYIAESAQTLRQNCLLSSTVTLGCASEQAFLVLVENYQDALNPTNRATFEKAVNKSWMIKPKHAEFMKWYDSDLKTRIKIDFSSDQIGELDTAFNFVFSYFRTNRNDAGHPSDVAFNRQICAAHLTIFPSYLRVFYDLVAWLAKDKPL